VVGLTKLDQTQILVYCVLSQKWLVTVCKTSSLLIMLPHYVL